MSTDKTDLSVETVLNSRCSSDNKDSNQLHWGTFDNSVSLDNGIFSMIKKSLNVPKICKNNVLTQIKNTWFRVDICVNFYINTKLKAFNKRIAWIESGMQQQAIHLCCATLGLGTVILNMGKNGRLTGTFKLGVVRMKILKMKPAYNKNYWTDIVPSDWLEGNLKNPLRKGNDSYFTIFSELRLSFKGSNKTNKDAISQLLWAAKGRTPHLYCGKRWGLTIPTWGGIQDITSVNLINDNGTFKYINWWNDRPTNSINKISGFSLNWDDFFDENVSQSIVVGINEDTGRAYWEAGYILYNLMLQATALQLNYKTIFLKNIQKNIIEASSIKNPLILFGLI